MRSYHRELTVGDMARRMGRRFDSVYGYLKRHKLKALYAYDQTPELRRELTNTTRFMLCVSHFEGYSWKELCDLFALNPLCVRRMVRDMYESGEYRCHLEVFQDCNPAAYARGAAREREALA